MKNCPGSIQAIPEEFLKKFEFLVRRVADLEAAAGRPDEDSVRMSATAADAEIQTTEEARGGAPADVIPVAVDVDPWQRSVELGEEVASLRRDVAALEERARGREEEISRLRQELAGKLRAAEAERDEARKRANRAETELATAKADVRKRDAEISRLRQELAGKLRAAEAERDEARKRANRAETELATAKADVRKRDAELSRLRKELDEKTRAAESELARMKCPISKNNDEICEIMTNLLNGKTYNDFYISKIHSILEKISGHIVNNMNGRQTGRMISYITKIRMILERAQAIHKFTMQDAERIRVNLQDMEKYI